MSFSVVLDIAALVNVASLVCKPLSSKIGFLVRGCHPPTREATASLAGVNLLDGALRGDVQKTEHGDRMFFDFGYEVT